MEILWLAHNVEKTDTTPLLAPKICINATAAVNSMMKRLTSSTKETEIIDVEL